MTERGDSVDRRAVLRTASNRAAEAVNPSPHWRRSGPLPPAGEARSAEPRLQQVSGLAPCIVLVLGTFCGWVAAGFAFAGLAHGQLILPAPGRAQDSVEQLINGGDLEQAETVLAARIEAQGETARNLLLRGVLQYRRESYEDALVDLRRSFALDEEDPGTSKALGLCLVKLGRQDLAETFFEIATELSPGDSMGHYYLGLNRYTSKRFELAVPAFEQALALRPDSIEARCYLGRSYEALGDTEKAGHLYLAAVGLNRKRPSPTSEPPLLLGAMLFRQQQLDRAETLLREALEYHGEAALAHYWLGLLFEQKSDLSAATRALERAAGLASSDHRPHYALARIYRRTGQRAKALEALRRFRKLRKRSESETY